VDVKKEAAYIPNNPTT